MNQDKIRIGIVDDNAINRNNFIAKMSSFNDLDISLVAEDGNEFLKRIKNMPMSKLPQVVFMDIRMPGISGIETIALAKPFFDFMHFIVLTVFEDDENIFEAIKSGATGYLLKHESGDTMYNAITELLQFGGAPMSPSVARKTLKILSAAKPQNISGAPNIIETLLTDREFEVLQQLVNGYDAKRIAELINISTLTVRKHIANIYTKLHVNSKAEAISLAHKKNLV